MGTSLWFSINGVADNLIGSWNINLAGIGVLTNAVQLGFVAGTLVFALSGIADRFRPSHLFAACALLGALFNTAFAIWADSIWMGSALRFLVGICLAGIYPIGMKLIMTWDPQKASSRIAQLVGMLTLGTAIPHATRYFGVDWPWQEVILFSSFLAIIAMGIIFWLGDGPHLKLGTASRVKLSGFRQLFAIPAYRRSALGYFGHMWELYAFWALVPFLIASTYPVQNSLNLSGLAFSVIGVGALGCFLGGQLSKSMGGVKVASTALALSGICCLLYPWIAGLPLWAQILFWLIWGMSVVADSPQFSALSVKACPPELVGSALTIQNSAGFLLTTFSILLSTSVYPAIGSRVAWLLLPGPIIGLWCLRRLVRNEATATGQVARHA
ncbi:MAG: MFS transporter [Burkholderiaceae bacterium]|nr:MFS transporter [Burkholderiaceae bacterium]